MIHNLLVLCLLLILFMVSKIRLCACEIKDVNIVEDSRAIILFERFGFTLEGHVEISIKHVSWKSKDQNAQLNHSSMGFFLVRDLSYPRILNESSYIEGFCVLSSKYIQLVLRFDKLAPNSTFNSSAVIDEPDEYNLAFGNCQTEFQVSMNVHTEMYNIFDGRNNFLPTVPMYIFDKRKDFLPTGQTPLPKLYFLIFLIYVALVITWGVICIKHKHTVYKIHLIMGALLIFMALKMICASEDKMYIRNTGTPHGWDVAFYVFGCLKGVTLFTVIILIGTGWSFLKPYLQEREKNVLMFVIPLQVLENVASVIINETSPVKKYWLSWNEMFLVIDVVCCFTIFIPIFWSIRSLRESSKTDGKAAKNLQKLTLFKQFYVVVIAYLYFTRIVVPSIGAIVTYKYQWVSIVAAEGASLIFYLFIFYNFQPVEKNPYLVIDDQEDAIADQSSNLEDSMEF